MKEFDECREIFAKLRAPDGCPWDRAQTHDSILQCAVDEVYEFLEAAEARDDHGMCEELGDLLLQVVFHSQMAEERGAFSLRDVIAGLNQKLYKRHPHVFGKDNADNPDQVLKNWEAIKQSEKPQRKSQMDGIPQRLPALFRAEKMQRKAAKTGFDWPDVEPVIEKVKEEVSELKQAAKSGDSAAAEEEFGDLLFALVNAGRHLNISAEGALRKAIHKFEKRFRAVEKEAGPGTHSLEELDLLWEKVKANTG